MSKKWSKVERFIIGAYLSNQAKTGKRAMHEEIVSVLQSRGFYRTVGGVAGELSRFNQAIHSRVFYSDYCDRKNYASWVNSQRVLADQFDIQLYDSNGDLSTYVLVPTEHIRIGKRGEKISVGTGCGKKTGNGFHVFQSSMKDLNVTKQGTVSSHKKVKTMTLAQANWPDTLEMLSAVMSKTEMANSINNYLMFKLDREPMKVSTLIRYVSGGRGYENKSTEFVMNWGQKLRDIANGKVKK